MMKKYEEYKESGSHWIGAIPISWNLSSLKNYVDFINGHAFKADNYVDKGVPIIRIGDVKQEINLDECKKINPEDYSNLERFTLKKEDILIALTGATIGKSGRFNKNELAYLNQRVGILRTRGSISQNFLYYMISSDFFQEFVRLQCDGAAQENIGTSDLGNFIIGFPPLPEQLQIASYLDHQTALIDALITKKEALIEKLKLQRQAVINEAVTRGLDENVKLVDSGVEWLGEIPEGWEVVKLRYLSTKIGSGVTPRGGAEVYSDEGIIFVRSQNVHFDGLKLNDVSFISEEIHDSMSNSKVQKNDVLLNITGASIGRCCVVEIEDEMNVNQHVCIIRPTSDVLSRFLNFVLQSNIGQNQVKLGTTGGNREGLNFEAIKEFNIPLTSIEQQNHIVLHVESITHKIGSTIATIQSQLTKLKLYRQSLISEAVTGKVDLREWGNKN